MIILDKAGVEGSPSGPPTYTYTKGNSLYRKVLNGDSVARWYRGQGINVENPDDLRMDIAYCTNQITDKSFMIPEGDSISGKENLKLIRYKDGIGIKITKEKLQNRQYKLKENEGGWKWQEYHPIIALSQNNHQAIPLDSIEEYPGPIYFSPESYNDVWENYESEEKSEIEPIIMYLPVIIKAGMDGDRRLIEVEASCEAVDLEGDIILQKALLDSAKTFIQNGHLDIDHKSEGPVARRLGIPNPAFYIVGRPYEVRDGGNGRTFVKGEISKSLDGSNDPKNRMYDMFWDSLNRNPPVTWYSSIYGMPTKDMVKNCQTGNCSNGAKRWLIKGIDWKSLAFTQHPINNALKGKACVLTAKAFFEHLKSEPVLGLEPQSSFSPSSMPVSPTPTVGGIMAKGQTCPECGPVLRKAPSVVAWKRHLMKCEMMDEGLSEIFALAMLFDRMLNNIGVK